MKSIDFSDSGATHFTGESLVAELLGASPFGRRPFSHHFRAGETMLKAVKQPL